MNLKKFSKSPPRQKIAIAISLFIVIMGAMFFLVIIPTVNDIKDLRENIIMQKIDLEKKLKKESNMAKLGEQLKKIKPEMDRFANIFVEENRKLEFITTIEGIADSVNATQDMDIDFSGKQNKGYYSVIPVEITVSGTYENVMRYLIKTESLRYAFNIDTISIKPRSGSPARGISRLDNTKKPANAGNTTMNLTAKTFWR